MITGPGAYIIGCCMGTGVEPSAAGYNDRGTNWTDSAPGGVAVIMRAAVAVSKLGLVQ